jgi:hypothetical protein
MLVAIVILSLLAFTWGAAHSFVVGTNGDPEAMMYGYAFACITLFILMGIWIVT